MNWLLSVVVTHTHTLHIRTCMALLINLSILSQRQSRAVCSNHTSFGKSRYAHTLRLKVIHHVIMLPRKCSPYIQTCVTVTWYLMAYLQVHGCLILQHLKGVLHAYTIVHSRMRSYNIFNSSLCLTLQHSKKELRRLTRGQWFSCQRYASRRTKLLKT